MLMLISVDALAMVVSLFGVGYVKFMTGIALTLFVNSKNVKINNKKLNFTFILLNILTVI